MPASGLFVSSSLFLLVSTSSACCAQGLFECGVVFRITPAHLWVPKRSVCDCILPKDFQRSGHELPAYTFFA